MALSVYQNLTSLNSQLYLGRNQLWLSKSVERLSSGLRINHAADDPSGLSISETLRGQITGLKQATMNAQDGMSYLQTAEGAMEEATQILQRMRELSVQAASGTYSANDRQEIQKEIDLLKTEIDRIANSTEFNTKKLTNGQSTGLWTTDNNVLESIIRSSLDEGNYEVILNVTPGKNQVQKSSIFSIKEDRIGAEAMNIKDTNVISVSDPISMPATGDTPFSVVVSSGESIAITSSVTVVGRYAASNSAWNVSMSEIVTSAGVTSPIRFSGYFEVEFTNTTEVESEAAIRYRFINAKTGDISAWSDALGVILSGATTATIDLQIPNSGGEIRMELNMPAAGVVNKGDKLLLSVSPQLENAVPGLITSVTTMGGATVQLTNGPDKVKTGPIIVYGEDEVTHLNNGDLVVDFNTITVYHANLDKVTGNINVGSVRINFTEQDANTAVETANYASTRMGTFDLVIKGSNDSAPSSTKLKDIKGFTNADNVMILDNAQELTLYGNNKQTSVYLEGDDTVAELVTKMKKAIVIELGMGCDDPEVNDKLVQYVTIPNKSGAAQDSVKGTMLVQSAITGNDGRISFAASQDVMDALGFMQLQEAKNNSSVIDVHNAHTGEFVATEHVNDNVAYALIGGMEMGINSRAGVDVTWNSFGSHNEILFSPTQSMEKSKLYMHIVSNRPALQIGANEGQQVDISITQLDLKGLGIEDLLVINQDTAEKAITLLDRALQRVSSARSTIGAQISRLEYATSNLATSRQNLITSESRIRDLDVAEESTNFATNQMLTQANIAMLAQANQLPQYVLQLIQGR